MSTRLRYECDEDGSAFEIEIAEGADLTGPDFVEKLVRPLMLGVGYHPDTIAQALGDE